MPPSDLRILSRGAPDADTVLLVRAVRVDLHVESCGVEQTTRFGSGGMLVMGSTRLQSQPARDITRPHVGALPECLLMNLHVEIR